MIRVDECDPYTILKGARNTGLEFYQLLTPGIRDKAMNGYRFIRGNGDGLSITMLELVMQQHPTHAKIAHRA